MNNDIFWGRVYNDILQIKSANTSNCVAKIELVLGRKRYYGLINMTELEYYDTAVLFLIKQLFDIQCIEMGIIDYHHVNYLVTPHILFSHIKESDYNPPTLENCQFRFKLAKLIYLFKLIGTEFNINNVLAHDGLPYYQHITNMGFRKSRTINKDMFKLLFGIEDHRISYDKLNKFSKTIIDHFRSCDFDTDVLRGILYLTNDFLKWAKGKRVKYKLSRRPRSIEDVIEENYSLLNGEYPFAIFNSF